jgi:hypothetical protein
MPLDLYSASSQINMSFDLDTYLDSLPTSLCSYSIKLQYSGEAANTNFIVFDILYKTRFGLKLKINHIRGEHTSYFTDEINLQIVNIDNEFIHIHHSHRLILGFTFS